jgi:hypothetical protein
LSTASPWLNQSTLIQIQRGITDEAYEMIPGRLLSLLRVDSIGSVVFTNGQMLIQFAGYDDYPYVVEVSTNLVEWAPVSTNYPSNGVFIFSDTPGPRFRCYRSVLLP